VLEMYTGSGQSPEIVAVMLPDVLHSIGLDQLALNDWPAAAATMNRGTDLARAANLGHMEARLLEGVAEAAQGEGRVGDAVAALRVALKLTTDQGRDKAVARIRGRLAELGA